MLADEVIPQLGRAMLAVSKNVESAANGGPPRRREELGRDQSSKQSGHRSSSGPNHPVGAEHSTEPG